MGFFKLLVAIGAAAYGISPVDIIPDVVPVVGWADDVGVILTALAIIAKAQKIVYIKDEERAELVERGQPLRLLWTS